jgi:hypothetical protein
MEAEVRAHFDILGRPLFHGEVADMSPSLKLWPLLQVLVMECRIYLW